MKFKCGSAAAFRKNTRQFVHEKRHTIIVSYNISNSWGWKKKKQRKYPDGQKSEMVWFRN